MLLHRLKPLRTTVQWMAQLPESILATTDLSDAAEACLGTHGYNPMAPVLAGSVAYMVVRALLAPILLVPLPKTTTTEG